MEYFGGIAVLSEAVRNSSIAVGTSAVMIAEIRPSTIPRRDILVRNISPNTTDIITVTLGTQLPTSNTGIVLNQGESFTFSSTAGDPRVDVPQCQFMAICATSTGLLAIMER